MHGLHKRPPLLEHHSCHAQTGPLRTASQCMRRSNAAAQNILIQKQAVHAPPGASWSRISNRRRHVATAAAHVTEQVCTAQDAGMLPVDEMRRLLNTPLADLMAEAAMIRDMGHRFITFSPKVFIPLTRLCRDSCSYCTFAHPPQPGRRAYMTLDEVLAVCRLGAQQGCTEALFTLGDKPELLYPEAAAELAAMGYSSTLEYVEAAAAAVLAETGLMPHVNAGVMSQQDIERLKHVSASQGLMLEGTAPVLAAVGGPHHNCPDKQPGARLATIEAAGRARVPFTSGILIGIGETRAERLEALHQLRLLHQQHGHIQEIIIQNFRAKPHTGMQHHPEPPLDELLWTVAAARIMFIPAMSIQAPPNLTPGSAGSLQDSWQQLLAAGINDWGGISPVTKDYVNPEKSWPHLQPLAAATAAAGKLLLPRLPVYPQYVLDLSYVGSSTGSTNDGSSSSGAGSKTADSSSSSSSPPSSSSSPLPWLSAQGGAGSVAAAVLRASDSSGLLRGSSWVAGRPQQQQEAAAAAATASRSYMPQQGADGAVGSALPWQQQQQQLHNDVPQQRQQQQQLRKDVPQQQQQQQPRASIPLPRKRAAKSWHIAVNSLGVLEGMPVPDQVSPDIQQLLDEILQMAHAAVQHHGCGSSSSSSNFNSSSSSSSGGVVSSSKQWPDQAGSSAGSRSSQHWNSCAGSSSSSSSGKHWSQSEVELLLSARGADMAAVVAAADRLRAAVNGTAVSYVVNRNINYTNVCTYGCKFCAFSKGKASEAVRGAPYLLPLEEITRRTAEAWQRGATEVCLQGGIHPDFTGETYLAILAAAKAGAPTIHVHAFSPLEVLHGATTLGMSVPAYLSLLKASGLGSLPGTAAEVLVPQVRARLCPDKLSAQQWVEVVSAAHQAGLPSTSTIMFGHVDSTADWARHLLLIRDLQARTGGITEFVPLPFVHMEAPLYLQGAARQGPTLRECVLLHAVARLVLHPLITNIQASWVKMGPQCAAQLLSAGCNDMGGSIMNESITRAAGASYGQELPPPRMEQLIVAAGRTPYQRTTLYGRPADSQVAASFVAEELQPVYMGEGWKQQQRGNQAAWL